MFTVARSSSNDAGWHVSRTKTLSSQDHGVDVWRSCIKERFHFMRSLFNGHCAIITQHYMIWRHVELRFAVFMLNDLNVDCGTQRITQITIATQVKRCSMFVLSRPQPRFRANAIMPTPLRLPGAIGLISFIFLTSSWRSCSFSRLEKSFDASFITGMTRSISARSSWLV